MASEDLTLYAEITKPTGQTFRWDGDGDAADIPTGIQVSFKRQDGNATANLTLPRRIDQDHPDIEIRDGIGIYTAAGDTVWQGRVSAAPRSMDDGHSIDVQAVGLMASARDRPFQAILVDRRFDSWGEASLARRSAVAVLGYGQGKVPASSSGGLSWTPPNELMPIAEVSELVYDCGDGLKAAKIMYRGTRTGAFTNFEAPTLFASDTSDFTSSESYGLTLDNATHTQTLTTPRQFLMLRTATSAATTPAVGHLQKFDQIAVYGDHGIPTHEIPGGTEPDGLYASEVMEWVIRTYCPKLTWAGNPSTYPIPHLVFKDLTDPYDALLACNAFHLLDLACWEDGKVYWGPVDLRDWDWEIRLEDEGVKITLEGDSDDGGGFNGIVVTYTDLVTGDQKVLWPDEHPELQDLDELNAANRHGDLKWDKQTLSSPATEASALQIGRSLLAERNQPKSPGQYTVPGYVRDRQGTWQPVHKMRSTHRVIIADHPNRSPRLMTECSYSGDSHTATVTTDNAIERVEGYLDRQATSLQAANLS